MSPSTHARLALGGLLILAVPALLGLALGAVSSGAAAPRGLRLHRTWMPEASPSSFAVGFPSGVNCCFDPIRGKVVYAWTGDFVDLQPTVNGKIPRDAVLRGEVFFRSTPACGFRGKTSGANPQIRFSGHRVQNDVPEFVYEVDGVTVRQSISPAAGGSGLVCRFRIAGTKRPLSFRAENPARVAVISGDGRLAEGSLEISGDAPVEFTVLLSPQ
jgi:hypothetical protein